MWYAPSLRHLYKDRVSTKITRDSAGWSSRAARYHLNHRSARAPPLAPPSPPNVSAGRTPSSPARPPLVRRFMRRLRL